MEKRTETINREIKKAENGFMVIKEHSGHTIYEDGEEVGAGATASSVTKIVTPEGKELENMEDVFHWLSQNYKGDDSAVTMDAAKAAEIIGRSDNERRNIG